MYCDRCWEDRSIIHTCTPCREYMLEVIQKEINPNEVNTTVNNIVVEKSNWKTHLVRWFNTEWIRTIVLTSMREMFMWFDEYYIKVYIWDMLDYLQSNNMLSACIDILWIRNNKRNPIDSQSDDCIRYIYSLLPSEVRKISFKL